MRTRRKERKKRLQAIILRLFHTFFHARQRLSSHGADGVETADAGSDGGLVVSVVVVEGLNQNSKPDLNKNVIQSFLVVPSSSRLTLSDETKSSNLSAKKIFLQSAKKSKSVFAFLTYLTETLFPFSYVKVDSLNGQIGDSNEIDGVSKFYISLSFGAKQNALPQIFFVLIKELYLYQ